MQVVLVTFKPSGKRVDIPIKSPTVTIGRGDECTIRVPAGSVSRKHCELAVKDDRVQVKDLDSSNGTFVNGDRIKEVFLDLGDMLTIGRVNFQLQINGRPAEIEPFQPIGAGQEPGAPLVSEDDAPEPHPPAPPIPADDEDDEDFLAVFEPSAGDAGDSVGVSLDGGAGSSEEDPLAALDMLGDEPEDPDKP